MLRDELWIEISNSCLQQASELLKSKTAPAAATAETVRALVETAIAIKLLDLRQAEQNRFYARVSRGQTIKGTLQEIADLVVQVQGRRESKLTVSNEDDFRTAAEAIGGTQPAILKRFASKDSEAEEGLHPEGL